MKKNILLGVTGGVAIYKSCTLARMLLKKGHKVKVVMTPHATRLIAPKLFEALTNEKVYVEMFEDTKDYPMEHIGLAQWADIVLIVPASANTIAKLAAGICDNLLTSLMLAFPQGKKIIIVPAMNTHMWRNPATQKNVTYLKALENFVFIDPVKGTLASGDKGEGVLVSLETILSVAQKSLGK